MGQYSVKYLLRFNPQCKESAVLVGTLANHHIWKAGAHFKLTVSDLLLFHISKINLKPPIGDIHVFMCSRMRSYKEKSAAKSISFMHYFPRNHMFVDRREPEMLWIAWWMINFIMFCIKSMLFGNGFQMSLNTPSKEKFHWFSVMDYQNVLLANLKALLVVFHTVVNRKQWLLGSPEISTMKSSSMVL